MPAGGPEELLTLGERHVRSEWPDYVRRYGLTQEDAPELARMVADEALSNSDSQSAEVWAPLHAWRALAQLGSAEAVGPVLELLQRIDAHNDDWVADEAPRVLGMLGPVSLEPTAAYLENPDHGEWARFAAARALMEIGTRHPEARAACVNLLARQLARCEDLPSLNGGIVSELLDLSAVEALPVMREAYERGVVDPFVVGDLEEVEITLGVREIRSGPPPVCPQMARLREVLLTPRKKVGRNEPCPCGSGLKYKKCCLNKSNA